MKYLIDTCVVSELIKKNPNPKVTAWITSTEESKLFLSVLTFGEIHKGIEKLPESKKKEKLHNWVNFELRERFENRIINFDLQAATAWGKAQALSESAGKGMPTLDGQIAATGIAHSLTVVTRNTPDMVISGVSLFNPWE
ncbi:MAG: type II toxin-antitoxin system VapC family toxin [Desulfobacterales bacterium]|nr:type II toxin-antitoxin system VapC family toxin [Desulfobacterales bacterium]